MTVYTKEQVSKIRVINIDGENFFAVPNEDEVPTREEMKKNIKKEVINDKKVKELILKYYKEHRADAMKVVEPALVLYLQYERLRKEMNDSEVKRNSKFLHAFGSLENKSISDLEDVAQFKMKREDLNMDNYIELSKRVTKLKRELNKELKRVRNNSIAYFVMPAGTGPFTGETLVTMHNTLFDDELFLNAVSIDRAYNVLSTVTYRKAQSKATKKEYSKYYDLIKEEI